MICHIDAVAHCNKWSTRTIETTVFCISLFFCVFCISPFVSFPAIVIILSIAVLVSGVPYHLFLQALILPILFIVFSSITLCFSVGISREQGIVLQFLHQNIVLATTVFFRSCAGVCILIFYAHTTPLPRFSALMRLLHIPLAFVEIFELMYRMIFLIDSLAQQILRAQVSRNGYRSLRVGFNSAAVAFSTLFISALHKAQQMEHGLASRNYQGTLSVLTDSLSVSAIGLIRALIPSGIIVAFSFIINKIWK